MIIFISDTIKKSIENDERLPEIDQALRLIANEYKRGTHIFLGDRDTLLEIYHNKKFLDPPTRKVFLSIYNNLTTLHTLLNFCLEYMEITVGPKNREVIHKNNKKIYTVPIEYIVSQRYLSEPILLCENLTDCDFFKIMYKWFTSRNHINKSAIIYRATHQGGGGNTTAQQYKQIQDEGNYFCLSIVDSDQKFPSRYNGGRRSYGDTAKQIQKINNEEDINTQYLILNVRETENLLPITFFKMTIEPTDIRHQGVTLLEKFEIEKQDEAIAYYDFKRGIRGDIILLCNSEENPESKFWKDIIDELDLQINHICNLDCNEGSCLYYPLKSLGRNPLSNFVNWADDNNISFLVNSLKGYILVYWIDLSSLIFSWFCGQTTSLSLGKPSI